MSNNLLLRLIDYFEDFVMLSLENLVVFPRNRLGYINLVLIDILIWIRIREVGWVGK